MRAQANKTVTTPFRLLGQVHDEDTGLASTMFRTFDADTGRWLSPDPMGIRGGLNLFAFGAAPTVAVDPFGLTTGDGHSAEEEARRSTLVARGGTCSADSFTNGSGVTTEADGTLSGVSTQSRPGAPLETLAQPFKNGQVGVTTVGAIEDAGGSVTFDGTTRNPNHATVNGLTAQQAEDLFTPTVPNPVPKADRGTTPNMPPNN